MKKNVIKGYNMQKQKFYNLTNPQLSIYLSEQFTQSPINNLCGTSYFDGNIDLKILKEAINLTIKNNDSTRTIIIEKNGIPSQYFKKFENFDIEIKDFSGSTMENFKKFQKSFVEKKFKLTNNLLFNFIICVLPNNEVALLANFNHIIADAWTIGLLIDQIASNYCVIKNNLTPDVPKHQYVDFIKRENEYINSNSYQKNKEFWLQTLKDSTPIKLKEPCSSDNALRKTFSLPLVKSNLINMFCKEHDISPYTFFLGVLLIYLYRTTSLNNFTIQTPIFNRIGSERNILGMFVNMIPAKFDSNDKTTIIEFLKKVNSNNFSYFKNSQYPYMHLLNNLKDENKDTQNYNVVFSFQKAFLKSTENEKLSYRNEWVFPGHIQEELVVNISDINYSNSYDISYDYKTALFSEKEIDFINNRLNTIIFSILYSPNQSISEINILPNEEQNLLNKFNKTDYSYDKNLTLIDLFKDYQEKHPLNTALIFKDKKYTYSELNNFANNIANLISSENIFNQKIAVILNKSDLMVATLLGILESGNCYVPIDPDYPEARINYIIENCNASLLITSKEYENLYNFKRQLIIDNLNIKDIDYTSKAVPDSLAYIIYTSGTTGNPKGVKIKHKNIINTLIWRKNFYKFDENIRVLQIPSFAFDSSVEDIFTPLISGSTLVIPSIKKMDINIICEEILKNNINHFLVVPSLYKILLHEKQKYLSNFKVVTVAGEKIPISLVKEHFDKIPNVRLINEYGPTENSVCSTFYELTKNDVKVLIGKPISNCKCYCLDSNLNQLPFGCKGELYVSGIGVSEGYLNMPEKTQEKFIKNPFYPDFKMYKTGDIVIQDFNGNFEFESRADDQIKLHGLRIELKEIETNILANKSVSDVVVLLKDIGNSQKIVAYFTTYDDNIDLSSISESLRKHLPSYMLPILIKLDKFPLTPNGKIDKKSLPLPIVNKKDSVSVPTTSLERTILDVCKSVLNIEDLYIDDDLFAIGGADSLDILTINSRLFSKGLKINTQDFYKYPTVCELAKYISSNLNNQYDIKKDIVIPTKTKFDNKFKKSDLTFNYKNVLLTGVTGFLGIHILDCLLKNTDCNIYCIIRNKNNLSSEKRLENSINFYFGEDYFDTYKNRIFVFDGNLSYDYFKLSQDDYSYLQKTVDCIINSAADTKHYGNYKHFEKENLISVENLIKFAKPANILFNHMSTIDVCGNNLTQNNDISTIFTENDLYIGQNYESNVYVCSKFLAEKLIIEEEKTGLRANIFRLGNLMARFSDGKFQKNKTDNAFFMRLVSFANLEILPKDFEDINLEFSPIDETAEAIVKLLYIPNLSNCIFHVYSDKLISINSVVNLFGYYNKHLKFVDYDTFGKELNLRENEGYLKYLVSDINLSTNLNYSSNIKISQNITNQFLDLVDFEWSNIDENYLKRFFDNTDFLKDLD